MLARDSSIFHDSVLDNQRNTQQPTPAMSCSWYCCDCQFGPHSFDLHNACLECGTMRCDDCSMETTSFDSSTIHSCSNEVPAYPSIPSQSCHGTSLNQLRTMPSATGLSTTFSPGLSLSRDAGSPVHGVKVYGATYMYFCCQCGDGPKVYNHQPQCVMCDHVVCSCCKPAK